MVPHAIKEQRRAAEQREYRRRLIERARLRAGAGQAPVTSEDRESARDRIPTVEVPATPMREMVYGAELDAELAQHAEAGQ